MQRITFKLEHWTRHQSMRDVRVARCRSTNAATYTDDAGARTSDASDNPVALGQIFPVLAGRSASTKGFNSGSSATRSSKTKQRPS